MMEVEIDTLERNRLASSVGESRFAVSGPCASRVLGLEGVLQWRQEWDKDILDTFRVQILAIAGVRLALSKTREGFEMRRHLKWRSTEGTEAFDALAEWGEYIRSLRDGERKVASVDEWGCVDEGEGDASRREEGLEVTLNRNLFGTEL